MFCRTAVTLCKRLIFTLVALCVWSTPLLAQIDPGYDLFLTDPSNTFLIGPSIGLPSVGAIPLHGIPISPGTLGNTDTIVQRFTGGIVPLTINIEIIELSLQSVAPINIGGSFFDVFVDIDFPTTPAPPPVTPLPLPPIPPNSGQLNVPGGTFTSFFDVFVDVQLQDISNPGNKIDTGIHELQFSGNGLWMPTAPPLYPGNPSFPAGGFYLNGPLQVNGGGGRLTFNNAQAPEPATFLPALGMLLAIAVRLRRR